MENPAFYLDDYCDEVMPTDLEACTLAGWAAWLAKGGDTPEEVGTWSFPPPADGAEYAASRLTFDEDIRVTRHDNREATDEPVLTFSREGLEKYDFAAVRYGEGMGWGPDEIFDPSDAEETLANEDCPLVEVGDEELIAVAMSSELRLVYRANPPRLEELGLVQ